MRKTRLVILPGVRSLNTIGCLLLFLACPNIAFKGQENRDIDTFCKAEIFKQFWLQDTLEPGDENFKKPDDILGNGQRLETVQTKLCDSQASEEASAGSEAASRFAKEDRSRRFDSHRTSDDNAARFRERHSEISRRNDRLDWERSLRMDRSAMDARRERTRSRVEVNNSDLRMERIRRSSNNRRGFNARERLPAEERSARRMSGREVEPTFEELGTKRSTDERRSLETRSSGRARIVTMREEIRSNRRENIRQPMDDFRINERRTERTSRSNGGVTDVRRTERNTRYEERASARRSAEGQNRFEQNSRRIESKSPSTNRERVHVEGSGFNRLRVVTEREDIEGHQRRETRNRRSENREMKASQRLTTRRLSPSSEQLRVTSLREIRQSERQLNDKRVNIESASIRMQAGRQRSLDQNIRQSIGSHREQSVEHSRTGRVRREGVERQFYDRQMPESRGERILAEQRSSRIGSTESGINRRLALEENIRRTRSERDIHSSNLSRKRLHAGESHRQNENVRHRQTERRQDLQQQQERETKLVNEGRADQRRNNRIASGETADRRLSSIEHAQVRNYAERRTRSAPPDARSANTRSRNEFNRRQPDQRQNTVIRETRSERERSESHTRGRMPNNERNNQVRDDRRSVTEEDRLTGLRRVQENMRRLSRQSQINPPQNLGPTRVRLTDERRTTRQAISVDDLTAYRRMTRDDRQVREKRDTQRRVSVTEDSSRVSDSRQNEGEARRYLNRNTRSRSVDERTTNRMAIRGERWQRERRESQNSMAVTRSIKQQDARRESADERKLSRGDRFLQEKRVPEIRNLATREHDSRRVAETARMGDSVRRLAERRNINNRQSTEERNVLQIRADRRTQSTEQAKERRPLLINPVRSMSGNRGERLVWQGRDDQRGKEVRLSQSQTAEVRRSERQTADERRSERQAADIRQSERLTAAVRQSERRTANMRQSERQNAEGRRFERQADIRPSERQNPAVRRSERRTDDTRQYERRNADVRASARQTVDERLSERRTAGVRVSERRVEDWRSEQAGRRISNGIRVDREEARFENNLISRNRRAAGRQTQQANYREKIFSANNAERRLGGDRIAKLENAQDSDTEERIKRDVLSMNDYTTFGKQGDEEMSGISYKTTKDAFNYWLWKLEGLRWTELSKVGKTLFYGGIMCYALLSSVNKKKAIF